MSEIPTWSEEQHLRAGIAESFAAGLAEHLAGQWVRCDPHDYLVAIRSGDRCLTIRPERNAALWRVVITADLPEGYRTHTRLEVEQTSVAADRPADQVARQVERRLLTAAYDAAITEVKDALSAYRDRRAVLAVAVAEIEALIPGARPYPHDDEGYTRFTGAGLLRGTFRLNYRATEADIKLDGIPMDLARDLAALIGKHLTAETPSESVR
jgi:hypothetical protein